MRSLVDYGRSGEALARSGLADDGYADYLRRAAKEAREARAHAIESERASSEREALSGYADYLAKVRREEGDRLVAAAEELLSMNRANLAASDRVIQNAGGNTRATNLLRKLRDKNEHIPSSTSRTDIPSVLSRIGEMHYDYDRAYRYCKLVGYSDSRAREIASFATSDYADLSDQVSSLFGD